MYPAVALALIISVWRNEVCRAAAVALVTWMVLAKIVHVYGEVETPGRLAAAMVYMGMCLVLAQVYKLRLFWQLLGLGLAAFIWVLYETADPYQLKQGLNLLWAMGVALVWKYFFFQ